MSSQEIADLTGKRHDHVIRDIKKMLENLRTHSSKLGNDDYTGVRIDRDYRSFVSGYHLPRRECYILITDYSTLLRARVIDRWQELEEQVAKPSIQMPNFRDVALANRA
jgi:phage regulator Rha-like protein